MKYKKRKNVGGYYLLEIDRKTSNNVNMDEYSYIYPTFNILSLEEQKIKTKELENITKRRGC